ncbi:MAG TPA: peptidoglycan DD-metalloendopeptidase family protein [Clostridiales bacterium]|nr:peptidoglycan DD-metalloendopeptidase family protein [Clostridiales bacterium]HPZ05059.1 peptidoglycan DD-metalloendopeptidase family protein [Clostridiales bacterium]HQD31680.1 peptidoglycan DD-metalloendopeptidase family protein [Clostridiales bacterium]
MRKKRFTLAILLIAITFSSVLPVMADELSDAKNKKASTDNRIADLKKKQQAELKEKARLEKEQQELTKQQNEEANAIEELEKQIAEAKEHLRQTELALAQATADYNQMNELVKTRLQVMYKNSETTMLDTLLSSGSVVEFYERLHYMQVISENDNKLMQQLEEARLDVELKKQMQEQAKEILEQKLGEREERLQQIKTSRARVEGEISRSKKEIQQLEKEIDKQLEESKRLESKIKTLMTKQKYVGGSMTWPVPSSYRITSSFGMRKHPILRKNKMHTGVDIGADKGASIVAANSGTVIMAHYDKNGYGNMVVIDHGGGITTLYVHASKLLVKVGDKVKSGQTIAKVGSTGLSTGNHLHFEVRVNGEPKDPMKGYLSK